jgi:ABC-type dipeptide/oligopeptide/nickel transport system ATPase component
MKIVGLIGEPASGKSTVMRKLISQLGKGNVQKEGLVAYTIFPNDKVIVAGIYDEQVFSGTDRLSKGCGPKYREWLTAKNADLKFSDWVFYWEGERFSNSKFFDFFRDECSGVDIYYLTVDKETLDNRNANRSNQNESWRKGMATRMRNLCEGYAVTIVEQGFSFGVER